MDLNFINFLFVPVTFAGMEILIKASYSTNIIIPTSMIQLYIFQKNP